MKKILTITVLLSFVINSFAQKIIQDGIKNNVRMTMTENMNFKIKKGVVQYRLCRFATPEKKEFVLIFTYQETEKPNNFPNQAKLTISTKSGQEIELTCLTSYVEDNYPVGMFPVSQEELDLLKGGTKKLAFELYVMEKQTGQIYRETREYKSDIGATLKKMEKKINKQSYL